MSRKLVLLSVLTVVVLVGMAVSAVAVFAFVVNDSAQVEDVLEVAPVQAEVSPKVVEPAVERASYQDHYGGCSHSKLMLTEAPAEEKLETAPLAQLDAK